MPQTLSQDEIDALLQGVGDGDDETKEESVQEAATADHGPSLPPDVRLYDFSRAEISVGGRLPGLEVIFNKFTRRLRNIFTSELGKSVEVGFEIIDVTVYEDLIKRIPLPSSMHLIRLEPMRGLGLFTIGAGLAYAMVDLFFGGTGERLEKLEGRDFTPLETNFMGKFVSKMLLGMEESWLPVMELTGRYVRSEMNPYLLGATSMGDMMIVTTYKIDMSADVTGDILFAFPLAAIEEAGDLLKGAIQIPEGDTKKTRSRLISNILSAEVSIRAIVDVVELRLQEILSLRAGDFIQLGPHAMDHLELWVEGKPKFHGRAAQSRGSKVFVVSQRLKEDRVRAAI